MIWFKNKKSAPTQAFSAVHIYGKAKTITNDGELRKMMELQVQSRESQIKKPWNLQELGEDGIKKAKTNSWGRNNDR